MQLYPEMIDLKMKDKPFLSLSDAVYDILFDHLLCFVVKPNQKLYASKIAEQLNVSRTTVANALKNLIQNGFVVWEKGYSPKVAPFNPQDYYNVAYARTALERTGAVQACINMTPEKLHKLKELDRAIELAWNKKDYYDVISAEANFHRYIPQCSENPYLIKAYDELLPKIKFYWGMQVYPSMINNHSYPIEHKNILDAFERGNIEVVKSSVKFHTKRPFLISEEELLERQQYIYSQISAGSPIKKLYSVK